MTFRSFLRSSRLEILLSRPLVAWLYLVVGMLILVWWTLCVRMFVYSYFTTHDFDVTVSDFFVITIFFFVPVLLLGCALLQNLLQRVRLKLWFRRQTNIPLYASAYSPAAAGYLADYEFELAEAQAMLLHLHFRGKLTIAEAGQGFLLTSHGADNVGGYERAFMEGLFAYNNTLQLKSLTDPLLLKAAVDAHAHLTSQLQQEGFLPPTKRQDRTVRAITRFVFGVGAVVAVMLVYSAIFEWGVVSQVLYPRFPVHPSQLWLLGVVSLAGLSVILAGFWPRFSTDHKNTISAGWLEAAGFKHYLQTVFADRLAPAALRTQDAETIRMYVPYMIAFRLVILDSNYVRSILRHTK